MSISAVRRQRMSNQITDAPETSTTRYLIQIYNDRYDTWRTDDRTFSTPQLAKDCALDGHRSPVPPYAKWRIVRSVSTWTTIDTTGDF